MVRKTTNTEEQVLVEQPTEEVIVTKEENKTEPKSKKSKPKTCIA